MPTLLILMFLGFVAYFFYKKSPTFNGSHVDYSFGDIDLQKIKSKIEEGEYTSAEFLIKQLESDDLHQAIDHVTLNGSEEMLLKWKEEDPDSPVVDLCLGVYYMHQGSVSRSNLSIQDITTGPIKSNAEYLHKANDILEKIEINDETIQAEIYARLIRVAGLTENIEGVNLYFNKCLEIDAKHLWAHIEYAEQIQPKLGGDIKTVETFIDDLTEEPLVNQVIYLKMVWDSVLTNENLFGGSMDDLKKQAKALLYEIDAELNNQPPTSIQRFVVYNYMTVVAEEYGIKALNQKYNKLMNGNFTCLLYTSPSPRDATLSRMPSSA